MYFGPRFAPKVGFGMLMECLNITADNYLRDVERYRNEMRDARNEADGIRTALTEGDI